MSDENTDFDIPDGAPDTGTALATTDGAPEGDGWQMPSEPDGPLDLAGNPEHVA